MRAAWVLVFAAVASCTSRSGTEALRGVRVPSLKLTSFAAGDPHTVKGKSVREFSAGDVTVTRIEDVSPEEAEHALKQKRFDVESLYQDEKSAYPGFISKATSCAKEYLPVFAEGSVPRMKWLRAQAAANSRKILGVCSGAEFKYYAVEFLVYCEKSRTLFEIKSFVTGAPAKDYLASAECG